MVKRKAEKAVLKWRRLLLKPAPVVMSISLSLALTDAYPVDEDPQIWLEENTVTLPEVIKNILSSVNVPMTPRELCNVIKKEYPLFYGTPSQLRSVEAGHCKNIDNSLLANIYTAVGSGKQFFCDRGSKPMRVSLLKDDHAHIRKKSILSHSTRRARPSAIASVNFEGKIADILLNSDKYHKSYYDSETFRGPSLYFHRRALDSRWSHVSLTHLEYVYATLSSWGMHRMGKGGSKMLSFEVFNSSVTTIAGRVAEAQTFTFSDMNELKWVELGHISTSINVMATGTSLIGNSKVMHHMLPNIVPPIDREYTLWYLLGNKNIKNDLTGEWKLMKSIISGFFIPVASDPNFQALAMGWLAQEDRYPWDTSMMKIIDNLVIGSKKLLAS